MGVRTTECGHVCQHVHAVMLRIRAPVHPEPTSEPRNQRWPSRLYFSRPERVQTGGSNHGAFERRHHVCGEGHPGTFPRPLCPAVLMFSDVFLMFSLLSFSWLTNRDVTSLNRHHHASFSLICYCIKRTVK